MGRFSIERMSQGAIRSLVYVDAEKGKVTVPVISMVNCIVVKQPLQLLSTDRADDKILPT